MIQLFLMQFFLQPLNGSVANYTQILLRNKGWSFSLIGVLLAAGQVTTILGPIFICAFAERKGTEKKALLACALLSLVFHATFILSGSKALTMAGYAISCAFLWSINPLADGIISKYCSLTGRNMYGRIRATGTAGYVIIMFLFSLLAWPQEGNNNQILINIAVFTALFMIAATITPDAGQHAHTIDNRQESREVFRVSWFDRRFYIIMLIIGLSRVSVAVIDKMLMGYMTEEMGLGRWFTAFIALGALAEFFVLIFCDRLLDGKRIRDYTLLLLSSFALVVRLLAYSLSKNIYVFACAQLLHGLTFGGCHIATIHWIRHNVQRRHYSVAMSFYHCVAINFPVMLGSLAGGFIVDSLGYTRLFAIYAVFPLAALVLGLISRRKYFQGGISADKPEHEEQPDNPY